MRYPPKAQFNGQLLEHQFYRTYFRRAEMANNLDAILRLATREATQSGVGPMDSLHIAAARLLNCDEFITTERPVRSIYRARLVRVIYLYADSQ